LKILSFELGFFPSCVRVRSLTVKRNDMKLACVLLLILTSLAWGGVSNLGNMPNFKQSANMCGPTSAANLLFWFGKNGFTKLIPHSTDETDASHRLISKLIAECKSDQSIGTDNEDLISGIASYIRKCGYKPLVAYDGIDQDRPPQLEWISTRLRTSKGVLLGCNLYKRSSTSNTLLTDGSCAHSITLVEMEKDHLVIHDPERDSKEDTGRREIKLRKISLGVLKGRDFQIPANGFYEMTGISLSNEKDSVVILEDAIAVGVQP
jgi:hypothetical protein